MNDLIMLESALASNPSDPGCRNALKDELMSALCWSREAADAHVYFLGRCATDAADLTAAAALMAPSSPNRGHLRQTILTHAGVEYDDGAYIVLVTGECAPQYDTRWGYVPLDMVLLMPVVVGAGAVLDFQRQYENALKPRGKIRRRRPLDARS